MNLADLNQDFLQLKLKVVSTILPKKLNKMKFGIWVAGEGRFVIDNDPIRTKKINKLPWDT